MVGTAYAASGQQGVSSLGFFLPFLSIIVVMYFFMIRPQQKKAAAHQKFLGTLARGDRVVTHAGIIGVVASVKETECFIDVADGVRLPLLKNAIAAAYSGTPLSGDLDKGNKEKSDRNPKKKGSNS